MAKLLQNSKWRWRKRLSCIKELVIVAEECEQRIGILLLATSTTRFCNGMGVDLKKIARVSPCFLRLKILKVPFWAT
jgi:hypothetical protein